MRLLSNDINPKQMVTTGVALLLIFLLWNTAVVYPLKILVVFFHELSHGIAAVLTGGAIERIELSPQQGGVCYTRGGWTFAITSAGYLGSMLFGGFILVTAARTRLDKLIMSGLGAFLFLLGLFYVRPLVSFAFVFVMLSSAGMMALGYFLTEKVNDFLLRIIGLTSCLYAIVDIKSDALDRNIPSSDAYRIAESIPFVGSFTVGAVWIIISVLGTLFFLRLTATSPVHDDDL